MIISVRYLDQSAPPSSVMSAVSASSKDTFCGVFHDHCLVFLRNCIAATVLAKFGKNLLQ